ncbi:MAG: hypothetical protein GY720_13435 [bacterium]|nr:hypothetical protein [bacterium]
MAILERNNRSYSLGLIIIGFVLVASSCGSSEEPATSATTTLQSAAPADPEPATTTPVTTSPATTSPLGAVDCPEVLAVELIETAPGVFNVNTTVRSTDIEGVSYADAWEVRDGQGQVLGIRVLTHPHANEQPFTRSLANVAISRDVLEVEVAARDSVDGFCGNGLVVAVPHS